jgi:hypothetical protein
LHGNHDELGLGGIMVSPRPFRFGRDIEVSITSG